MIQIEYLNDGTLIRHYSDTGMLLLQNETGEMYADPIDVVPCAYTYTETDEPAEREPTPAELFSIENNEDVSFNCENIDETLESEVIVNG